MASATALAKEIADQPRDAVRMTKALFRRARDIGARRHPRIIGSDATAVPHHRRAPQRRGRNTCHDIEVTEA
jgi:enoyl-CoA hydratase/carnithine racemase